MEPHVVQAEHHKLDDGSSDSEEEVDLTEWGDCMTCFDSISCADYAEAVDPRCPKCHRNFGIPKKKKGTQPKGGSMTYTVSRHTSLPGCESSGTIVIQYFIPAGVQKACHPEPGKPYNSLKLTAYLPDNMEGNEILKMLRKAFDSRLVFTVSHSTNRATGDIIWNGIHHMVYTHMDITAFGYLKQVREELAAKGILSP